MNVQGSHTPSLFAGGAAGPIVGTTTGSTPREARTLIDLMYDGFYLNAAPPS
jgi:hypothetical protein